MKLHSATSHAQPSRSTFSLGLPRKENIALVLGVALAFVFVTTCIFTLG